MRQFTHDELSVFRIDKVFRDVDEEDNLHYYMYLHDFPITALKINTKENITEIIQIVKKKDEFGNITYHEVTKKILGYFIISKVRGYKEIFQGVEKRYDIQIKLPYGRKVELKRITLPELKDYLESTGIMFLKYGGLDPIHASITMYGLLGEVEVKDVPQYPGFFIIGDKLVYSDEGRLPPVDKDKLRDALILLDELIRDYKELSVEAGYVIKWFISAPTSFARKQLGRSPMPWMYVFGRSRAGKTILGHIGTMIWGLNIFEVEKGPTAFLSEAKFGANISQSTYPLIVNEGERLIQTRSRDNVSDMIKDAVYTLVARERGTITGGSMKIPALNPLYITSNVSGINSGELGARFEGVEFHLSKPRTKEEMMEFDEKYRPLGDDSPLRLLVYLGSYIKDYFILNPSLLELNWRDVSEGILVDAYEECGLPVPEWIYGSVDMIDYSKASMEEEELIFDTFTSIVLEGVDSPEIWDPSINEYKTNGLYGKVASVLTKQPHSWLEYRNIERGSSAGEWIYIRNGISLVFEKKLGRRVSLKGLQAVIGGELKRVRWSLGDGKSSRVQVLCFSVDEFYALFGLSPTGDYIDSDIDEDTPVDGDDSVGEDVSLYDYDKGGD